MQIPQYVHCNRQMPLKNENHDDMQLSTHSSSYRGKLTRLIRQLPRLKRRLLQRPRRIEALTLGLIVVQPETRR